MVRLYDVLTGSRKRNVKSTIASMNAEIAALKKEIGELYARNDVLGRENRKLSIRNAELSAAYNGLKEILRNRGVSTP